MIRAQSKRFDLMAVFSRYGKCDWRGTVRDVMLDRHPLFWMTDINYMIVIGANLDCLSGVFIAQKICPKCITGQSLVNMQNWLNVSDAIGLASFSLIGVSVALRFGSSLPIAMLMGIVTVIVGGMIRDIICNEIADGASPRDLYYCFDGRLRVVFFDAACTAT